jgi:hypothetical protein
MNKILVRLSLSLALLVTGCGFGPPAPPEFRYEKPVIGMSQADVLLQTRWATPKRVSKAQAPGHDYEYWYWGKRETESVTFDNGRVVAVHE